MHVIDNIRNLYKTNKFSCLYGIVTVSTVVGFVPNIPQAVIYFILALYAFYCFKKTHSTNALLAVFLIYIPVELLLTQPSAIFKSWERYFMFALLLACISPLFESVTHRSMRMVLMQIVLWTCTFLGIGSFFARFLGINYMAYSQLDLMNRVGMFGGLTNHSMLLGPIAGIGSLYMSMMWYQTKKKIFILLAFCCLLSVMFSASRSALMATVAANIVMLYKMSGTGSHFVKIGIVLTVIGVLTFPLWGKALNDVMEKQNANIEAGGSFESRSSKWEARIEEFKNNPLFGVGFASVDLNNAKAMDDTNGDSGVVETGSSWLCIFSMTGLIGAFLLLPVFYKSFIMAWKSNTRYAPVVVGMLVLFYVHMIAEGYVLAGGSFLAFCLWLSVGLGYDCKYDKKMNV